jgi:VanZ family protein
MESQKTEEATLDGSIGGRYGRTFRYWGPVGGYAAMIFFLSSMSSPELSVSWFPIPHGDKMLHAGVYGGLGLLVFRAVRGTAGDIDSRSAIGLAVLAASLYGISDELHQLFVPHRHADVWDWVADTGGALMATWGWSRWGERPPPTSSPRAQADACRRA